MVRYHILQRPQHRADLNYSDVMHLLYLSLVYIFLFLAAILFVEHQMGSSFAREEREIGQGRVDDWSPETAGDEAGYSLTEYFLTG